eukprot:scaffold12849_cov146-Isochrysis_galbana.AAC.3
MPGSGMVCRVPNVAPAGTNSLLHATIIGQAPDVEIVGLVLRLGTRRRPREKPLWLPGHAAWLSTSARELASPLVSDIGDGGGGVILK